MLVIALCTACFCRAKISKKNFGPPTLNALAPALFSNIGCDIYDQDIICLLSSIPFAKNVLLPAI